MSTYILGNGGFCTEVVEQFINTEIIREFGGFLFLQNKKLILISDEGAENFTFPTKASFVLGTGSIKWRLKFIELLSGYYECNEITFPNMIAKSAKVPRNADLGIGNMFCDYSVMNGNAQIGNFNLFNLFTSIHHDSVVGNHNVFCPYSSALGYTRVENRNFVSAYASIMPKFRVGSDNAISTGEAVFENIGYKKLYRSGIVEDREINSGN